MTQIYVGFDNRDHNDKGLISIDESELKKFLLTELGFNKSESGFPLAFGAIAHKLREGGICAIWTQNGTATFLSERVVRQTVGDMLANDFFSVSSRRGFVKAVVADMKKRGL